jgi:hypothetical protein
VSSAASSLKFVVTSVSPSVQLIASKPDCSTPRSIVAEALETFVMALVAMPNEVSPSLLADESL